MYLVAKFYDNDFGTPMLGALTRLWEYIYANNSGYADRPNCLTVEQVFQKLHECEALQPMLLRLFVLENLCQVVEGKTRGLFRWAKWTEEEVKIDKPSHLQPDTYLQCDVAIYGQYKVIPDLEWANSENAFMNLEDGMVGIF